MQADGAGAPVDDGADAPADDSADDARAPQAQGLPVEPFAEPEPAQILPAQPAPAQALPEVPGTCR